MSSPTHVRFPDDIDAEVAAYAQRHGTAKSAVVVRAVNEWLRMQAHPGIIFRTLITGERVVALEHSSEVWTVIESWMQHEPAERTVESVAWATGLTASEVETALRYYADFRDEIDAKLERNVAEAEAAYAAWKRRQELNAG